VLPPTRDFRAAEANLLILFKNRLINNVFRGSERNESKDQLLAIFVPS
jgi:hypothetical protein